MFLNYCITHLKGSKPKFGINQQDNWLKIVIKKKIS